MPHSLSPESKSPHPANPHMEDSVGNGGSELSSGDVDMTETADGPVEAEREGKKKEVKLEDLFADVDSDEEFLSSQEQGQSPHEQGQGSPKAPSSPGYESC